MLAGWPSLKVLMATSSKSPSITLNISQYLFEYVFRVSPSLMDKDNKEAKGWGTLLHVIKRDLNAWMSSLKESMEPAFRLSNHLIVTGPRLDRNILHIKASFLECTAILWLKWLTCSIGSVLLLYKVNVGWVNHWGNLPPSIQQVKATWKFGWVLYSQRHFPSLPKMNFYFGAYGGSLHRTRRTCWGESLTSVYSLCPSHH